MTTLYNALRHKPKVLVWSHEIDVAFNKVKDSLTNATLLVFPKFDATLALTIDASAVAVRTVLKQYVENHGNHLVFSVELSNQLNRNTAFSTESFSLYISLFVTFDII
ncbi:hypothetical protein RF11_10950 [Thelohanellus kitauei]|uniref:Reverse transcriptase/retrotransposon-derived protein RNase H-like domain-containing protein n=1 Tax=Thelohanellus kitauei TaxID=669202 RepID=A0A0C2N842_THEKT|nr:hypothetical protein RF11_10950 [Thelohanellus kitauei]